jgi:hypothetical protein
VNPKIIAAVARTGVLVGRPMTSGSVKTAAGWTSIAVDIQTGNVAFQTRPKSHERAAVEQELAAVLMATAQQVAA